jgi:hypothetical protein
VDGKAGEMIFLIYGSGNGFPALLETGLETGSDYNGFASAASFVKGESQ